MMPDDTTPNSQAASSPPAVHATRGEKITRSLEAAIDHLTRDAAHSCREGETQAQVVSELGLLGHYQDSIIDQVPRGIIVVDFDGNVTTYNRTAQKILEIPASDVLFQSFWKNFTDKVLGFSLRQALKEKKSPGQVSSTMELEAEKTKEIEAEASLIAGKGGSESGSFEGMIVVIQDVTEQKYQEVIAQRMHRMHELGEMAAMVAHEIRNPLGGIKGFASLLERDLMDRPDLKKMASYIIDGTTNLNDLVTRVLEYSRPIETHFEPVDIVSLIRKIQQNIMDDENYRKNIRMDLLAPEENLVVTVDQQSIRKCISNLVENAIHAMPEGGGQITLSVEPDNRKVIIKVKDTGVGIPKENFKKLFSPFFSTRPDGDGFGLSEVHKIIQLHGGKVEVESQEGIGTTFTLLLPVRSSDHESITSKKQAAQDDN